MSETKRQKEDKSKQETKKKYTNMTNTETQKQAEGLVVWLGAIIFFSMLTFGYYTKSSTQTQKSFDTFAKILTQIGLLVTAVGLFYNIYGQSVTLKTQKQQQTLDLNSDAFIFVEGMFMNNPGLMRLYAEMNSNNPDLQVEVNQFEQQKIDPSLWKNPFLEAQAGNIIFQKIENTLTVLDYDPGALQSTEWDEWVRTWRLWFMSPTLRKLWQQSAPYFYSQQTQNFVRDYILNS